MYQIVEKKRSEKTIIIDKIEAYTKFTSDKNLIGFSLLSSESLKENI